MIIDFFNKAELRTDNVREKLKIISQSDTENANYVSSVFIKAIEYFFKEIEVQESMLKNGFPVAEKSNCALIYFSDDKSLKDEYKNYKFVIVVGSRGYSFNDNVEFMNVRDISKIKKKLLNVSNIDVGFDLDSIKYAEYYYNMSRCYFLHLLELLRYITIEELQEDVEGNCTWMLLNKNNFKSEYNEVAEVNFKKIMRIYATLETKKIRDIFYMSSNKMTEIKKDLLNNISKLVKAYSFDTNEEKISYAYDEFCKQMCDEARNIPYCNFVNNKCIASRYTNGFPNSKENGCCSNTYLDKGKDCRYLKTDHSCSICSISCRAFVCYYLQKRGIDHAINQYPIIDFVVSKFSKPHVIYDFFTPKEKAVKKLRWK